MTWPLRFPLTSREFNRRSYLRESAYGIGSLALAHLMGASSAAEPLSAASPTHAGMLQPLHRTPRAKRVIHLCMAGGPSHLESFDYKPALQALDGQPFPASLTAGQQLAQLQNSELKARGPFTQFSKCGAAGQEVSQLFPHISHIADDICIIRSMVTDQINHDPAQAFMNSGSTLKGRPSMGSWLLYGLGAETEDLPGFVVLVSKGRGGGVQPVSARQWSSGFLPGKFQGVEFRSHGDAVNYIGNPDGVCQSTQRLVIDEIKRQNDRLVQQAWDEEIQTRIAQYELAFRMQTSVPDLTDFRGEGRATLERYGIQQPGDGTFASNCLLARRLAERGVRFIQLYHRAWDHHSDIVPNMTSAAQETDQATAALIDDLRQRGMLEDTLVIWGGEFGRTPMAQGSGRDHHILAFSIWMAGGGVKPGITYGATDELGYRSVEDVVTIHDLHATILALCGIDFERFSIKFQGLDARLTGVEPARVVHEILA